MKTTPYLVEYDMDNPTNADKVAVAANAYEVVFLVGDKAELHRMVDIVWRFCIRRGEMPQEDADYLEAGREDYFDVILCAWRHMSAAEAWHLRPRTLPRLIDSPVLSLN